VLKALLLWKEIGGFAAGGNWGVRFDIDAGCTVGVDRYERWLFGCRLARPWPFGLLLLWSRDSLWLGVLSLRHGKDNIIFSLAEVLILYLCA
jgi:hypothetical protein